MKNLINKNQEILKGRNNEYQKNLTFNGLCLLFGGLISLILFFCFSNQSITILYFFPIYLIATSIYKLITTTREKNDLVMKEFITNLSEGVIILSFVFYLFLNNIKDINAFIIIISICIIFYDIVLLVKYDKHSIFEYITMLINLFIALFFIIFSNSSSIYLLVLVYLIIIGLIKTVIGSSINKKNNH